MSVKFAEKRLVCDFCGAEKPFVEIEEKGVGESGWIFANRQKGLPKGYNELLLKDAKLQKHSCNNKICQMRIFLWMIL